MYKKQNLLKLARLRQETRYDGYNCICDYEDGFYECDYVSPYSKSAHNVNADVFIILQDWSSDESLKKMDKCHETNKLGYTPKVRTNKNLQELLKDYLSIELNDTYATNLFPFIKKGLMSANIPQKDMQRAAKEFTLPMIEIIQPKITIALGMKTFNALRKVIGLNKVSNMNDAVKSSFDYDGTRVFFQTHPSQQAQNTRGKSQVKQDWLEMKKYLND